MLKKGRLDKSCEQKNTYCFKKYHKIFKARGVTLDGRSYHLRGRSY